MKIKKLLLSLGTLAAVAAPVASVVSCGITKTTKKDDVAKESVEWTPLSDSTKIAKEVETPKVDAVHEGNEVTPVVDEVTPVVDEVTPVTPVAPVNTEGPKSVTTEEKFVTKYDPSKIEPEDMKNYKTEYAYMQSLDRDPSIESEADEAGAIFGRFYTAWAKQHKMPAEGSGGEYYGGSHNFLWPADDEKPVAIQGETIRSNGHIFFKFFLAYNPGKANYGHTGTLFNDKGVLHAFWNYKDIPSIVPFDKDTIDSLDDSYRSEEDKTSQSYYWDTFKPLLKDYVQDDGSFIVPEEVFAGKKVVFKATGFDIGRHGDNSIYELKTEQHRTAAMNDARKTHNFSKGDINKWLWKLLPGEVKALNVSLTYFDDK